jgi:Zn-dependent metalloprotease
MRHRLFIVLLLAASVASAQETPEATALRVAEAYKMGHAMLAPSAMELRAKDNIEIDTLGQAHVRFQQFRGGVPVFEGETIVHVDLAAQTVVDETDATLQVGAVDLVPRIHANHARDIALTRLRVGGRVRSTLSLAVVMVGENPHLAWRVRVEGSEGREAVDRIVFVDALSGGVLLAWDNLQSVAAAGTGKSFFNGQVALTTDQAGVFTDADATWGGFAPTDPATAGVDAQYGAAVAWDYFKNVHGRNGIANNGVGARNRVHYSTRYNNAFWSDSCFCMSYGDGDGITFNPFASIDVAGHGMTHGVTSRTSNLTYLGESGGLNEATSDIFGTMVEFYAANPDDPADYLIGERLYKSGARALRSMIKPSSDGVSADCWYSSVRDLDVHYSSGVANHFFHLLAEGTSQGSRTCVTGNTQTATGAATLGGIGRSDAERIWYRAVTVYMTPSTNYAAARVATLKAATDLFGATSTQYASVAAAWTAVLVK